MPFAEKDRYIKGVIIQSPNQWFEAKAELYPELQQANIQNENSQVLTPVANNNKLSSNTRRFVISINNLTKFAWQNFRAKQIRYSSNAYWWKHIKS